ncbi:equilibrative nucleoside transporter 1-like isoform X2 [Limulus polyphemus]|uniref:Equilibrative nucleoside transporter 1-like isoform X2 n=1 Tax=Limulus polyphemus TaxID=6850 RepID=A0ABM1BME5_LIMPO|nr:equilibrative nucleoside transporter 1-like isoform X2 [Limulus polyphemus]
MYGRNRTGFVDRLDYLPRDCDMMERETLLAPGPVKLTPSWESRNITNDELNFKNGLYREEKEPRDRLNLVYIILMLHGVGTLMPWNMFITAKPYFVDLKLSVSQNDTRAAEYRDNFLSYLGVAAQVPNVFFNGLNLFLHIGGGKLTKRITISIIVAILVFILTVILAVLDTSGWPEAFFYITMISVVILNMANGVYQNCVYGVAAKLPMKYLNAVVLGSNVSGTIASLISILSIAASPNLRTAAIYYFITAIFVLLVAVDTYFALPLTRFYRYHEEISRQAQEESKITSRRPPFWKIFKKTWRQCFNVFFVFFVTLTSFPAVQGSIFAVDSNFFISSTYFIPVCCFLFFNLFAMIGNIFPNWVVWPGPRFLWIPVVSRILFIPFFMMCNYKPQKRAFPVLISSDWAYIIVSMFHGLSSGYYSSLAMMYVPRCVEIKYASTAGMMGAFFLILGIFSGVNFSFFISWLVETPIF